MLTFHKITFFTSFVLITNFTSLEPEHWVSVVIGMDFLPLFATHAVAVFPPDGHRIATSDVGVFSGQNAKSNICIVSKGILVWLRLVQLYFWAAILPFMQEGKKSLNLCFLSH